MSTKNKRRQNGKIKPRPQYQYIPGRSHGRTKFGKTNMICSDYKCGYSMRVVGSCFSRKNLPKTHSHWGRNVENTTKNCPLCKSKMLHAGNGSPIPPKGSKQRKLLVEYLLFGNGKRQEKKFCYLRGRLIKRQS